MRSSISHAHITEACYLSLSLSIILPTAFLGHFSPRGKKVHRNFLILGGLNPLFLLLGYLDPMSRGLTPKRGELREKEWRIDQDKKCDKTED